MKYFNLFSELLKIYEPELSEYLEKKGLSSDMYLLEW